MNIALVRIIRINNEKLRYMVLPGTVVVKRIQAQNKTTVMLLSISSVFVLCNLLEPFSYVSIYTAIFGECSDESTEFEIFRMFASIFQSMTYASNFVSYCLFHNLFLSYVGYLFTCRHQKIQCHPKVNVIYWNLWVEFVNSDCILYIVVFETRKRSSVWVIESNHGL